MKIMCQKVNKEPVSALHNIKAFYLPPIRVTSDSSTSIDFACANFDTSKLVVNLIVSGLSDHTGQLCKVNFPDKKLISTDFNKQKLF